MKYYEKCSLGDSLSAFFSESHGPVAVVIYIGDEEARKDFCDDLEFLKFLGESPIHGDNVEWIPSAFDSLLGFIMNYGHFAKTYFNEGKCVVVSLNPGFDAFDEGSEKEFYLFDALKRWGAKSILKIIVEADRTFLSKVNPMP